MIKEQIGYSFGLIFLGCLSGSDIREKMIPVKTVIIFGVLAVLYLFFSKSLTGEALCRDMLPGIFLLLLSFGTKESIGAGDGMAVLVLGLWTNIFFCAASVCAGSLLAGFFGLIRMWRKKKEPIPFLPFLLCGMEVLLVYI